MANSDQHANLLSQHGQFKPSLEHAPAIVAARWHTALRQQRTTPADCDKLASAFNYAGFELDPKAVLAGQ